MTGHISKSAAECTRRVPFLCFVTAAVLFLTLPSQALAAGLLVNTLADNSTSGDGFCTLREAITAANNKADFNDCGGTSRPYGADTNTSALVSSIVLRGALPTTT